MKVNWKIVKDILKPTSTASIIGGVLIAAAGKYTDDKSSQIAGAFLVGAGLLIKGVYTYKLKEENK
jgi:hypothetical protein|uniref:Uncharacterized protein n=1 Tax=Myoviridae sp. ctkfK18 TaxID=2825165 RepID=A0A8S5VH63_9CAUD|nr:MAG TPA: hypothetical protein [Myoviridae sp. ctkfK18]